MTEWDYKTEFVRAYPPEPITWEQYMVEPYLRRCFDILDGVRYFRPSFSLEQSEIKGNLVLAIDEIEKRTRCGQLLSACYDVLISRDPFRTRQPVLAFMSNACADHYWREHETEPVQPAPELVVEFGSAEDKAVLSGKLADYQKVGVCDCWLVWPIEQTVEVLSLTPTTATSVATYPTGHNVQSVVFPDLVVSVDAIFAE